LKAVFFGKGITLVFCLFFLAYFGNQKAEASPSTIPLKAEVLESKHDFNDFGLTQRQIASEEFHDQDRKLSGYFIHSLSDCFCPQINRWARLALFFSHKSSFKDLSVLYHNLRI
jgi:hypothetical protein